MVVEPGMEVVADLDEVEARLLGAHGLAHELLRAEALGEQLVAELHDAPADQSQRQQRQRRPAPEVVGVLAVEARSRSGAASAALA